MTIKKHTILKKYILFISTLVLISDQATKYLIVNNLDYNSSIFFLENILNFRLVHNTGAAFSLFSGATFVLGLISFIVSFILIIIIWKKSPFSLFKGIGFALLLGGSLGNGIDRWKLGYVIDFLEIVPFRFPIFNLADAAINLAVIFLLLDIIKNSTFLKNN